MKTNKKIVSLKYILITVIILSIFSSCGKLSIKNESTRIYEINNDSLFVTKAVSYLQEHSDSPKAVALARRLFELSFAENPDHRDLAFTFLLKHSDPYNNAVLYNSLCWNFRNNKNLFDKNFDTIVKAVEMTASPLFADSLYAHNVKNGLSDDEQESSLYSYKSNIFDTYAWYLYADYQFEDAIKVYEKILKDYKDTNILLNYGNVLSRLNRYQKALEAAVQALELSPGSSLAEAKVRDYAIELAYSKQASEALVFNAKKQGRKLLKNSLLANYLEENMPEFNLQSTNGDWVSSQVFEGKILIINFWASWCNPCISELPYVESAYNQFKKNNNNIAFISISKDKNSEILNRFLTENAYSFPVLLDDGVSEAFNLKGIPSLVIVDQQGIIRYKKTGYNAGEELAKILEWYINSLKYNN